MEEGSACRRVYLQILCISAIHKANSNLVRKIVRSVRLLLICQGQQTKCEQTKRCHRQRWMDGFSRHTLPHLDDLTPSPSACGFRGAAWPARSPDSAPFPSEPARPWSDCWRSPPAPDQSTFQRPFCQSAALSGSKVTWLPNLLPRYLRCSVLKQGYSIQAEMLLRCGSLAVCLRARFVGDWHQATIDTAYTWFIKERKQEKWAVKQKSAFKSVLGLSAESTKAEECNK